MDFYCCGYRNNLTISNYGDSWVNIIHLLVVDLTVSHMVMELSVTVEGGGH